MTSRYILNAGRLGSRVLSVGLVILAAACSTVQTTEKIRIDYDSAIDAPLQSALEQIDRELRERFSDALPFKSSVGIVDLRTGRLAMIDPDRIEYAASIPKLGILLAYFALHSTNVDAGTKHDLGLMAKASSNEAASKFSQEMGLKKIQEVLNSHGFYDAARGGGIWVGKHYGNGGERIGDPVGDNSHAATVRQLLRFYVMLEQGQLISPEVSKAMREILESPEIPHDQIKFVKGLAGRDVKILRKWGSWQDWLHDSAIVEGRGRKYVLVALTKHPRGDEYLEELARRVDDLLAR